jgi:endonuclease G
MPTLDQKELWKARWARDRAIAFHLFDPNVALIDVGWQIEERQDNRVVENLRVRAHLRHKPRGAAFEAYSAKNPERIIRAERIGFPVDIIEARYPLQWWYGYWSPPILPRARVFNPLRGGVSVSRAWSASSGTLGGIVRDRDTGEEMILSNWHVLAASAYALRGASIFQPAYADGGWSRHTVAQLERHTMDQGIDAAVAKLTDARSWINDQLEIGAVSGVATPTLGMKVTKSGRTSEVTSGRVVGFEGVTKVWYGEFQRMVRHVVHIAPFAGGQVSTGGDSGSWWLEEGTNRAVGLHFAGSDDPEYALAMDMPRVLNALNVDIATS